MVHQGDHQMQNTEDDSKAIRLQRAVLWAKEAGKKTLNHFQKTDLVVERKEDNSPVTIADQEAEQFLRQKITEEFPDDALIGEEYGSQEGSSGFAWILDPIDGTKSFISGVPLYGTLVGVTYREEPILGVIYLPGLEEGIYAATGQGAWHFKENSRPSKVNVSTKTKLSEAVFVTSQIDTFSRRGASMVFEELQKEARVTRTWGDCYGYFLVATGRADFMVDPIMNIWDAAPMLTILQEAGGHFIDWQGEATIETGEGLATNGLLKDSILEITKQAPPLTPKTV
ncbi:MAG: histidinol-phosphatase [Pirellulaceae bacterium]|nr:histidinol-phosphatase [Pirellulaceae bacterium]